MKRAVMLATVLAKQISYPSFVAYVASLSPTIWYRFNEPSGTIAINYGSLGSSIDGTYTSVTLAQAGKSWPANAILCDGANSLVSIPANASGNYSAFTFALLVNMTTIGESNQGYFFENGADTTFFWRFVSAGAGKLQAFRNATGSMNGISSDGISLSTWYWLFWTLDFNGDKKVHLYRGNSGAVTEFAYSTQTTGSGTLTNYSARTETLVNRAAQGNTLAGLVDEFLVFNSVLSAAQMLALVQQAGV